MAQTDKLNTGRPAPDQFDTRGYVITEDADLALRDVALGLNALALIIEEHGGSVPDLNGADWGSIFRTFGRQAQQIYQEAAFANRATARKRELH